jgi:ABC-type multidrug transport system fused ATPase/permease subunit
MIIAHASGRWVSARTTRAREANAALTASIQELIAGFRVLRFFGRGSAATAAVQDSSWAFASRNLAATRLRLGLPPIYSTLMMSGILFVIWQGGERVISGAMTLGVFVAYLGLFVRFTERAFRIPQLLNSIQSGGAAYARLEPMLAPALNARDEPRFSSFKAGHIAGAALVNTLAKRHTAGPIGVSLEHVTFRYPGAIRAALADLSLEIPPGSLVAVTGPVGAGKSTLARALLGVYPVDAGDVRLSASDGAAVAREPGLIGYLPQRAHLFSGSIQANVLMGREDASPEIVARAVQLAALDKDVAGFAHGLKTQIGELGVRISGGQQQRLGLARAIAASNPDLPGLLVLDDPFSAIDVETETRIISALREAFGPRQPLAQRVTILLCSQRLAAFPHADHVVVLENGRIEEEGAHAELLGRGGLYARIFRAQARTEAAEAESRV